MGFHSSFFSLVSLLYRMYVLFLCYRDRMRVNGRITTISLVEDATHHFKSRSNYAMSSQRLIPIVLQSTLFYPPVFTSMRCQRISNHLYFQTTPRRRFHKTGLFLPLQETVHFCLTAIFHFNERRKETHSAWDSAGDASDPVVCQEEVCRKVSRPIP